MAKRFTDTEIWDKEWFMNLPCRLKCLVKFVRDKADLSGVWSPNWALANSYIGEPVNQDELLNIDDGRQFILAGKKILCLGFIEFQYGKLSEKSPVHRKVMQVLETHKIPYKYPINRVQEEDKDKEEEKEVEKDKDKEYFGKSENLFIIPEMLKIFQAHNTKYPASKDKDYKPLLSIANYLCEIGKLPGTPDQHRDKVLEAWEPICKVIKSDKFYSQKSLSTISNHIQEILQISLNGKSNGKPDYGSKERAKEYDRLFAERYGDGRSATG